MHRRLEQLPSILRVPSQKIPRSSQIRPEAFVSPCAPSPVSSRVLSIVSRLTPRLVSRLVSKSRESPEITDKCDEMMANIGMKINAEIAQNRFQGNPRGTQNRLKIAPRSLPGTPWRPRSSQGPSGAFSTCPGIVLGLSRQRPGSARRVPKPGPGRQEERPGALRGGQNRCRGASGSEKSEFFACAALAHRLRSDYSTMFVDFRIFRKTQKRSNVLRLPIKIKVQHFAL